MKANRLGRNTLHRRHQSVAPRCMEKAEAQQMYISPSKLNIGIKDSIYQGSAKNSRNDLHLQQQASALFGAGGPSSFSGRHNSHMQFSGMVSPAGSQARQQNYLDKLQSEKRNKIRGKKMSVGGIVNRQHPLFTEIYQTIN